ncbi:MAG: zinc-ribbon domain containing protein, partial [Marinicellaceae bacterium]
QQMVYGRLKADHSKLGHINSYGGLPDYYDEIEFRCRDCGVDEIWTARQQKFYFEECKGHIDARAVRCKACRRQLRQDKKEQQAHMQEMKNKLVHPNALFFQDLEKFKRLK